MIYLYFFAFTEIKEAISCEDILAVGVKQDSQTIL